MDLKEFFLHKLTLQIANGAICYLTAHAAALFGAPYVQTILKNVFVDPTIRPGANEFIKAAIGTAVVTAGQVAFHHFTKQLPNPVSIQGGTPS